MSFTMMVFRDQLTAVATSPGLLILDHSNHSETFESFESSHHYYSCAYLIIILFFKLGSSLERALFGHLRFRFFKKR